MGPDKSPVLHERASPQPTVKPSICLPPVITLKESPCPKTKRGSFLFVWVSCSAVISSTLVTVGLVGCCSPSQAIDWGWLIALFVLSLLGFAGWGLIWREYSRVKGGERELQTQHFHCSFTVNCFFIYLFLTNVYGWIIGLRDVGAVRCWMCGQFQLQSLYSYKTLIPLLAVNEPQSSKRS